MFRCLLVLVMMLSMSVIAEANPGLAVVQRQRVVVAPVRRVVQRIVVPVQRQRVVVQQQLVAPIYGQQQLLVAPQVYGSQQFLQQGGYCPQHLQVQSRSFLFFSQ